MRKGYSNKIEDIHLERADFPRHVNIPALKEGRVGGMFWSAFVPCSRDAGANFTNATWRVRDTLEQIDGKSGYHVARCSTFGY